MAQRLVQMNHAVITLDSRYGKGSTWACMPACGQHDIGRGTPRPIGITLGDVEQGAYDGTFSIGTPTSAPPAIPR